MAGVNKVILLGRLGKDPEVRTLDNGAKVCSFSIATSETFNDREGQRQERTEWHNVVLWRNLAELAEKYLSKGREVYIEGKLQTRSWDDQNGQKRYTTEIVGTNMNFVGSRNDNNMGGQGAPMPTSEPAGMAPSQPSNQPNNQPASTPFDSGDDEDDLPF